MLTKMVFFKAFSGKSEQISNILGNSKFLFSYFNKLFEGNWALFIFQDFAFFETAYGQI